MFEERREEEVRSESATYEPPAVEEVLRADELEREVLYAGTGSIIIT